MTFLLAILITDEFHHTSGTTLNADKDLEFQNKSVWFQVCVFIAVKIWNEAWHLQMVFVGHEEAVMSLAVFPFGPLLISSGRDCTLRVWSFETRDEVDR